jgi:hypothetical protein
MQRYLWLAILGSLISTAPALAQERDRSPTPSGEIQIPSGSAIDNMLDQNTVPDSAKDFSTNDAKAIQQMDERAKRIDRKIMKGICTDC